MSGIDYFGTMKHGLLSEMLRSQDVEKLPYDVSAIKDLFSEERVKLHFQLDNVEGLKRLREVLMLTPLKSSVQGHEIKNLGLTLIDLIQNAEGSVYNCSAEVFNNTMFWRCIRPSDVKESRPSGRIEEIIKNTYGSVDDLKKHFVSLAECQALYGCGWVFLVLNPITMKLTVQTFHGSGNPLRGNIGIPLMCCDLWEHAFLLDYKVDRRKYIEKFFDMVNWQFVNGVLDSVIRVTQESRKIIATTH
eukprot:TRINITY_DN5396_c0_g1::TRINITY_DN5396_c0_g1_i1::g.24131::m.24131 TRINITY_DN5396_c0_g1::TRINITY_DN5396_c0_g1_i1::g.24131  ORF type:complete len:246 (-),score=82.54,sp/Q27740/SODF_PLAFX/30.62/1e-36,Sod_Fe_C/PF02777.13/2.9e-24,Sod_Fe_N/PF00081.17/0.0029 TRINITY_DN5396_c0_g1_i1:22-759(-)